MSAPTTATKAHLRLQAEKHKALEAFVRSKAGRSETKRREAIERAARKGTGND